MDNSNLIKDNATREAIKDIERTLDSITNIPQLSQEATLKEVIVILNKITNNIKRR